jgi:hypothetical protein
MPKKGAESAAETAKGPREESVPRLAKVPTDALTECAPILFDVSYPSPMLPIFKKELVESPKVEDPPPDAKGKKGAPPPAAENVAMVNWGTETEKFVDFSTGTPGLPEEEIPEDGVVVEWKRISDSTLLEAPFWKVTDEASPMVNNPEDAGGENAEAGAPTEETNESQVEENTFTVVRVPHNTGPMPRRIVTKLDSTCCGIESTAAPALTRQMGVLQSVFVMVSAISTQAVDKVDRVLQEEDDAAAAAKAEAEKDQEPAPISVEDPTEEELAAEAALKEERRARREAMIDAADMIPKGAFLWEAIYPKGDDGLPKFNPGGRYTVRLFVSGAWRHVDVDDRIPVDPNGSPLLCRSTDKKELWPLILSKALCAVVCGQWKAYNALKLLHHLTGLIPAPADIYSDDIGWPKLMKELPHTKIVYDDDALESPRSPRFYDDDGEMEAQLAAEQAEEEAAMGLVEETGAVAEETTDSGDAAPREISLPFVYVVVGRPSRDTELDPVDAPPLAEDGSVALPGEDEVILPLLLAGCANVVMETRGGDDDTNIASLVSDDPEIAAAAAAALALAAANLDEDDEETDDDRQVRLVTGVQDANGMESGWLDLATLKKDFNSRTYCLVDPNDSNFFTAQVDGGKHWAWTWVNDVTEGENGEETPATTLTVETPEAPGKWEPGNTEWSGPQYLYFESTSNKKGVDGEEQTVDEVRENTESGTGTNEMPYLRVWVTLYADLNPIDLSNSSVTIRSVDMTGQCSSEAPVFRLSTDTMKSGSFLLPQSDAAQVFSFEIDTIRGAHVNLSARTPVKVLGYSELQRDVWKMNHREVQGAKAIQHPEQWSVLSRSLFSINNETGMILSCNISVKNPFIREFLSLYIVDNSTRKATKFPLLSFEKKRLEPNDDGFILFLVCQSTGKALPAFDWSMDLVSDTEFQSFDDLATSSIEDFEGVYIPNKYFRMFRDVLSIPDDSGIENPRGSLRLTLSDPTAYAILRVLHPVTKATIAEKSGRGYVMLLDIPFQTAKEDTDPDHPNNGTVLVESIMNTAFFRVPDELKSKRPYHFPTGQPGDNAPSNFTWNLRVVGETSVSFNRDREEELSASKIRASWEEEQPGRAVRASSSRSYFLARRDGLEKTENSGLEGLDEEERGKELSRRERVEAAIKNRPALAVPIILNVPEKSNPRTLGPEIEKEISTGWVGEEEMAKASVDKLMSCLKARQEAFEKNKIDRLEMLKMQHLAAKEQIQATYRKRTSTEKAESDETL